MLYLLSEIVKCIIVIFDIFSNLLSIFRDSEVFFMNTIGDRIKKARKENNLTLTDINNMTGLSTGNLSELENNKFMPSANALILLKKVLNVSIDWMLTGESGDSNSFKEGFYSKCLVKESKEEEYPLRDNEKELIEGYRKLNEEQQHHIMSFINICLNNMDR